MPQPLPKTTSLPELSEQETKLASVLKINTVQSSIQDIRAQILFTLQQKGLTPGTSQNDADFEKGEGKTKWLANRFADGHPDPNAPIRERLVFYSRYCHTAGFVLEESLRSQYNKKYVLVTNSVQSAHSVVFNTLNQSSDSYSSSIRDGEIEIRSLGKNGGIIAFDSEELYTKFFNTRNKQGANISQFAALSSIDLENIDTDLLNELPELSNELQQIAKDIGLENPNSASLLHYIQEIGILGGNNEVAELEALLAEKNSAKEAIATSSGESAISAAVETFVPEGGTLLSSKELFGTSNNQLTDIVQKNGKNVEFLGMPKNNDDCDIWEQKIDELKPSVLFLEVPNNPTSNIIPLVKLCKIANTKNIPIILDTTFAPAHILNVLDILQKEGLTNVVTITSLTKFYDGHNGFVGGAICTNNEEYAKDLRDTRDKQGKNIHPLDALYFQHSSKEVEERIEQQSKNAQKLGEKLKDNPFFKTVSYLGLDTHPQHDLAKDQFAVHGEQQFFGSMIVVELNDVFKGVLRTFLDRSGFPIHANLGQIFTMLSCPAETTHSRVSEQKRKEDGITGTMVRISCGLEDIDDIIAGMNKGLLAACVEIVDQKLEGYEDDNLEMVRKNLNDTISRIIEGEGDKEDIIRFLQKNAIHGLFHDLNTSHLQYGIAHLDFWKRYFPSLGD